jgi:RNA polymerase sigma factor (sigma-70 family)
LQQLFISLLPVILNYVRPAFRNNPPEQREELIEEALANCYEAAYRLMLLGKESIIYPTALARYAIKQVRVGRKVGTRLNVNDISSSYSQQRKTIKVDRLDRYDAGSQGWKEAIIEDRRTPIAEQVWFRIDFPIWLSSLSPRDRKIAQALAAGHTTGEVAKKFGLSCGRVSQLRLELYESWQKFHGEEAERERIELLTAA